MPPVQHRLQYFRRAALNKAALVPAWHPLFQHRAQLAAFHYHRKKPQFRVLGLFPLAATITHTIKTKTNIGAATRYAKTIMKNISCSREDWKGQATPAPLYHQEKLHQKPPSGHVWSWAAAQNTQKEHTWWLGQYQAPGSDIILGPTSLRSLPSI